jgi:hypothetical protein
LPSSPDPPSGTAAAPAQTSRSRHRGAPGGNHFRRQSSAKVRWLPIGTTSGCCPPCARTTPPGWKAFGCPMRPSGD